MTITLDFTTPWADLTACLVLAYCIGSMLGWMLDPKGFPQQAWRLAFTSTQARIEANSAPTQFLDTANPRGHLARSQEKTHA